MVRQTQINYVSSYCLMLLITCITAVSAQKLPNVQQGSLLAPSNIKIDGKATEWGNKFQAYNNATNTYYTIANDNDNLYLTITADDESVVNKIIRGGIIFTVNANGKKDTKEGASITYPVFGTDAPSINLKNKPKIIPGDELSLKKADSAMYASNKLLDIKSKYILTKGIKGLDTLLSVYNDKGIKAAQAFDNRMVYTCEFAVNLKFLNVSSGKFAYNIKLNGVAIDELMKGITVTANPGGDGASFGPKGSSISTGVGSGDFHVFTRDGSGSAIQLLTNPTDFWGEYTLAKK